MTAILSILSGIVKAIATALGMARDKQLRNDGANAQTVADLAAENKGLKNALDVAVNPPDTDERLRNGGF